MTKERNRVRLTSTREVRFVDASTVFDGRFVCLDVTKVPSANGHIELVNLGILANYTEFFTGTSLEILFEDFATKPEVRIPANEYTIGNSTKVEKGQMLELEFLQMHYHTVSEHTINGFHAPGELHIVTKVKDGESDYCDLVGCLAVFGIWTVFEGEGGEPNEVLEQMFATELHAAGVEHGEEKHELLNLNAVLPESLDYYTYLGSLTTPPCSEIVSWHMFAQPIVVSPDVIEQHQFLVAATPGDDCVFKFGDTCFPPREKTDYRRIQKWNERSVHFVEYDGEKKGGKESVEKTPQEDDHSSEEHSDEDHHP